MTTLASKDVIAVGTIERIMIFLVFEIYVAKALRVDIMLLWFKFHLFVGGLEEVLGGAPVVFIIEVYYFLFSTWNLNNTRMELVFSFFGLYAITHLRALVFYFIPLSDLIVACGAIISLSSFSLLNKTVPHNLFIILEFVIKFVIARCRIT